MKFSNNTDLQTHRLTEMIHRAIDGWSLEGLSVAIRFSRGADFSGSCHYVPPRIFVNLGRHIRYPYLLRTHIARARSEARSWWRELYTIELADGYQLVLFIFLHEFYHWLIRKARRNGRQKEGRCDRFAARVLVNDYAASVRDTKGHLVPRAAWDFQDLEGFVAAARPRVRAERATAARTNLDRPRRPQFAVEKWPASVTTGIDSRQLWLFNP